MATKASTALLPLGGANIVATTGILGSTAISIASGGLFKGKIQYGLVAYVDDANPAPGDDGGWEQALIGIFHVNVRLNVYIAVDDGKGGLVPLTICYSGYPGQGNACISADGQRLTFISPPLPVGTYSLLVLTEGGVFVASVVQGFFVVARDFSDRLYSIRANHPPPRAVGPYDLREEEVPS